MHRYHSRNTLRSGFAAAVLISAAVFLLTATAARAGDKSSKEAAARAQALALFQKALAVSDIRAPGSPPFELQGTIDVPATGRKVAQGSYLLKWAAPDKWREEIHFPNYFRIRVGSKDGYFQSRSIPYETANVYELSSALSYLTELRAWARTASIESGSRVEAHQRRVGGLKADCVTIIRELADSSGPEYCFDSSKALLLSAEGWRPFSGGDEQFSNFTSFGGKLVPNSIRVKEEWNSGITFVVASLTPLASITEADFQRPTNATVWASCGDPNRLLELNPKAYPVYPISAGLSHAGGDVITFGMAEPVVAYGVIGTDGRSHDLELLEYSDNDLTSDAVSTWNGLKYQPEICHGTYVPTEIILRMVFRIDH